MCDRYTYLLTLTIYAWDSRFLDQSHAYHKSHAREAKISPFQEIPPPNLPLTSFQAWVYV